MLKSIGNYAGRGISIVAGAFVFILTLPLVVAASFIMMVAGMIALANIRHRLREVADEMSGQSGTPGDEKDDKKNSRHKPPIEGSYKVVKD